MTINLSKAKGAIEGYRTAHTLLHENPPEQLSEAHDPLTFEMRKELEKHGFKHEGEVFTYSDNKVLNDMGYSSREDFFNTAYDMDGNVISGKENDDTIWKERFK